MTSRRRQALGLRETVIEEPVEPAPDRMPSRHRYFAAALLIGCGALLAITLILWQPGPKGDAVAEIAPPADPIPRVQALAVVKEGPAADDLPLFVPEVLPEIAPAPAVHQPAWRANAVKVAVAPSAAKLAIILDDMGLDRKALKRAAQLEGPLTFSFLPYARSLPRLTAYVKARGHELMVHLPMEPHRHSADPGPHALLVGLGPRELDERIAWNLSRFEGFVGLNNHMGSLFTEDTSAMKQVLAEVKKRGLLFVDSRTSDATVGTRLAADMHVPHRARDIFLDHERSVRTIRRQLREAVDIARSHGSAIAIGHPHNETLSVLGEDLPRYAAQGVVLVPVSALVEDPDAAVSVAAGETSTATP